MVLLLFLSVAATTIAALVDARTGQIPNWLTLGALAAGLALNGGLAFAYGGAMAVPSALLSCVVGAALCSIVPLVLYGGKAIGGGDVKLFIALGAISHAMIGLEMELAGFVAGALLAIVHLAAKGKLASTLRRALALLVNPLLPKARRATITAEPTTWFRLGPAIFLGTAWVAFSHWGAS
jgi:prepilin peptidase CpaA